MGKDGIIHQCLASEKSLRLILDVNGSSWLCMLRIVTLVSSSDKAPGRVLGLQPRRTDAVHRRPAQTLPQRPSARPAVCSGEVQAQEVS